MKKRQNLFNNKVNPKQRLGEIEKLILDMNDSIKQTIKETIKEEVNKKDDNKLIVKSDNMDDLIKIYLRKV